MVPTAPQARPCLPTPSAGIVAARLMGLELERDRWRRVAREWYVKVIAELPGPGKLHHHLYPTIHCTVHMACTLADLMPRQSTCHISLPTLSGRPLFPVHMFMYSIFLPVLYLTSYSHVRPFLVLKVWSAPQ